MTVTEVYTRPLTLTIGRNALKEDWRSALPTEEMNMAGFETRVRELLREAEQKVRAFDKDARKMAETLGDRAQAGLKEIVQLAQTGSREQVQALGAELEKLGKKLQTAAAEMKPKGEPEPGKNTSAETLQ
jgi:hypothetical protein